VTDQPHGSDSKSHDVTLNDLGISKHHAADARTGLPNTHRVLRPRRFLEATLIPRTEDDAEELAEALRRHRDAQEKTGRRPPRDEDQHAAH